MITKKEYELIQAYLDNQLDQSKKEMVEKRLEKDNYFNDVFIKFRNTRELLRLGSKARIPRNFTLSQEQFLKINPFANLFWGRTTRGVAYIAMFAFIFIITIQTSLQGVYQKNMVEFAPMMDEMAYQEESIDAIEVEGVEISGADDTQPAEAPLLEQTNLENLTTQTNEEINKAEPREFTVTESSQEDSELLFNQETFETEYKERKFLGFFQQNLSFGLVLFLFSFSIFMWRLSKKYY